MNALRVSSRFAPKLIVAAALTLAAATYRAQPPAAPPAEAPTISVSAAVLDHYLGRYRLNPNFVIHVTREGTHLYTQGTGQNRFEIFPTAEKEFVAKVAPVGVTFVTDAQGNATALIVHQGGRDRDAPRLAELVGDALKQRTDAIDAIFQAAYAAHPVGSLTAGVVLQGSLVWTQSYGEADMEQHRLADQDTVYRIGSITKMFTAVMLEQLVEAGKVHLTDSVEKYFPAVNTVAGRQPWAPPITLFELATHTSGLSREPADTAQYVQGAVGDWEKTLAAALPHARFIAEPGVRYSYSNIGYATLGAALGQAAGESYLDYVPRHIFQPLGMSHSSLVLTPEVAAHLAKGYEESASGLDSETPARENREGRGYKVPNGAIYTTVGDLARFASFLLGEGPDAVLKRSSLERFLAQTAFQADGHLSEGYGLGIAASRQGAYTALGHSGAVAGYVASLQLNRDAGAAVIVLCNSGGRTDLDGPAFRALDVLSK